MMISWLRNVATKRKERKAAAKRKKAAAKRKEVVARLKENAKRERAAMKDHQNACKAISDNMDAGYEALKALAEFATDNADTYPYWSKKLNEVEKNAKDIRCNRIDFTETQTQAYYRACLGEGAEVLVMDDTCPLLERQPFDIEDYNLLLKSDALWAALEAAGVRTALTVQDDGFLVRADAHNVLTDLADRFDYVGAPWADIPANGAIRAATGGRLVGNGGLSLRRVSRMREVIRTRPPRLFMANGLQPEPEDVYFAAGVHTLAPDRLCSTELAACFSSEQLLHPSSLGMHKPWPYHSADAVEQYFAGL